VTKPCKNFFLAERVGILRQIRDLTVGHHQQTFGRADVAVSIETAPAHH